MSMSIYRQFIPRTDPRLGRHIRHDSRSLAYPFISTNPNPTSIRHERFVPVWDQGQVGSCTGNAALGALGTGPLYSTVKQYVSSWDETMALSVYSAATGLDGIEGTYPPDDTGSDGLSVAQALKNRGWINGYRHVLNGAAGLTQALQTGPVIIGIPWYESMFTPTAAGFCEIAEGSTVAGGHEIVVDAWTSYGPENYFGLTNSWGESWGLNGKFNLTFDTMEQLLSEQGDATVFTPITQAPPAPITDPALARLVGKTSHWVHSSVPWIGASGAQRELKRYLKATT